MLNDPDTILIGPANNSTVRHYPPGHGISRWLELRPWDTLPHEALRETVLAVPVRATFPGPEILNQAIESHKATGADITRPDQEWLPGHDFTIFDRRTLKAGQPLPKLSTLPRLRLNMFVPSRRLISSNEKIKATVFGRTKGIHVTLAEKCSMGCRMCPFNGSDIPPRHKSYYQAYMKRRAGYSYITPENFAAYVTLIQKVQPVRSVSLFGPGEPFTCPSVTEILRWCSYNGISLNFTTNGNSIRNHHLAPLRAAKINNITISADAVTAETYRAIKPNGDWNMLLKTVTRLRKLQEDGASFRLTLSFIRQPINEHEEESFHAFWGRWADETVVTSRYHMGQPMYQASWNSPFRLPCTSLFNGVHVLTNGDCWTCSAGAPDEFMLGNLLTDGPEAIWEKLNEYMTRYLAHGMAREICKDCSWWRQSHHLVEYESGNKRAIIRPYSYKILHS